MVVEVTSKEFRANQKSFIDMALEGVQVIIRRGKSRLILAPIEDEDTYFTPDEIAKIKESIKAAEEGKVVEVKNKEELFGLLDTL
ncbi:prevent-host-death protein [Bacteroidales bacterium OttesenSCG-928-A17]|nr:prevent-host-death protein [Bacteroidales bacterium OttesenSCG-928-A17]